MRNNDELEDMTTTLVADKLDDRIVFFADSMPQLVWIARPDGFHEYYNKRWYEYTGTEPGSTDGDGWKNLFHQDDIKQAEKTWQHSLKTGDPYEVEYRLYHAETDMYRWVIGRAQAYTDKSGKVLKWYGTCTDIDDQKRHASIQEFLAQASKELSMSLDYKKTLKRVTELSVPKVADWCSVDIFNPETGTFDLVAISHVDQANLKAATRYRELHPVTPDQPTGTAAVFNTGKTEFYPVIDEKVLKDAALDDEARELLDQLKLSSIIIAPLTDRDKPIGTISFVTSDSGRHFDSDDLAMAEKIASRASLSITNAKLYDDSLQEITRRKELEKELQIEKQKLESRVKERTAQLHLTNEGLRGEIKRRQEAELELMRSNKELQDFAYVASHDLQEPLRKIQAFGDILMGEYAEQLDDGKDYLERMMNASSRMSSLIQDLLTFSRVTNGGSDPVSVDLNEVVAGVVDDLSARIDDVQGEIKICDLPTVMADPTHMRQLFQNLFSNALKFHKPNEKPLVKVSATEGTNTVTVKVSDNGIGFDEKYAEKIFSVFQRLHGRDEFQGTGIGLAVCRKIVEKYGGSITAKSKPGEGATFIIRLKKSKEEQPNE